MKTEVDRVRGLRAPCRFLVVQVYVEGRDRGLTLAVGLGLTHTPCHALDRFLPVVVHPRLGEVVPI